MRFRHLQPAGYWRMIYALLTMLACMVILFGCSYTNCTITKIYAGGDMEQVKQVPVDKSTQGAVTSSQTVSPTSTVTGIPGL